MKPILALAMAMLICSPQFAADPGPSGIFRRTRTISPPKDQSDGPEAKLESPITAAGLAAVEPGEVDTAEIIRRGDRVVSTGRGPMSSDQLWLSEATAPPADDSAKWFVSIIVDDGPASQALLYDLRHAKELRAWVNIDEPKDSWSHATIYRKGDATQDWRWKNVKFAQYPVMILQPPAKLKDESKTDSWLWGDPKTVIWQFDGYDAAKADRAKQRSDAIRKALQMYVDKVSERQRYVTVGPRSKAAPPPTAGPRADKPGHGQELGASPPFSLPGAPSIPASNPVFPTDPSLPSQPAGPAPAPSGASLLLTALSLLTTGTGATNFLLLAVLGLNLWRHFRQATGKAVLLDDASFADLTNALKALGGQKTT